VIAARLRIGISIFLLFADSRSFNHSRPKLTAVQLVMTPFPVFRLLASSEPPVIPMQIAMRFDRPLPGVERTFVRVPDMIIGAVGIVSRVTDVYAWPHTPLSARRR
jgi:hypothetical protein